MTRRIAKSDPQNRIDLAKTFLDAQLRDIQLSVDNCALQLARHRPENFAFWEQTASAKGIWIVARNIVQDALGLLTSGKTEPQRDQWRKAVAENDRAACAEFTATK